MNALWWPSLLPTSFAPKRPLQPLPSQQPPVLAAPHSPTPRSTIVIFFYRKLLLSVLKLHVNEITQCVFCIKIFIHHKALKFSHVAYISSFFYCWVIFLISTHFNVSFWDLYSKYCYLIFLGLCLNKLCSNDLMCTWFPVICLYHLTTKVHSKLLFIRYN